MNKKELQEKLLALWELGQEELAYRWTSGQDSLDVIIWQKRPNIAVRTAYKVDQRFWCGYGFAKVMYPDVWDAQYGIDLAVKKALASIARQIVEEENGE